MSESIVLSDCKHGFLYRIRSRNLKFGVFCEKAKGFLGIREKFGSEYVSTEYHWDTGAPFGTANPKELLEECPITDLVEGHSDDKFFRMNQPLFDWLKEKEQKYSS